MILSEKTISNLIESHFPFFYQEENPVLIEFVKQYFQWMEQEGNTLYHTRNLTAYKDIDNTVDEFLIYFKEKYLKSIQFSTAASTRRMVKHSLDLYRSKGTPRAIDLLFKVVFNTPAEVYLPGKDIFRLSSGDYYTQYYLEVDPTPINITFVGKQIIGVQSGATAFVEKLIRKKIKEVFIEIFIISGISPGKHFITGEVVKTDNQISVKDNPKISGSLTNVNVLTGSKDFVIGDIVNIDSELGIGAKGRVTNIADVTGQVSFTLVDHGFGYTSNAQIHISEKVLKLTNVVTNTSITSNNYFISYDTVIAPQAKINYITSSNTFSIGDNLYTYYSNGSIKGYGKIQNVEGNTTSGNLSVSIISGNLYSTGIDTVNAYYTTANGISANLGPTEYSDQTATGKVVGTRSSITLNYVNSYPFILGETVYQLAGNGTRSAYGVISRITSSGLTGEIDLANTSGVFDNNKVLYGNSSLVQANVTNISVDLGIEIVKQAKSAYTNATASFVADDVIYLYNSNSTIRGTALITTVEGNTTLGNIYFTTISGNLQLSNTTVNAYYTSSNAKSLIVNSNGYIDTTKAQFYSNVSNYIYSIASNSVIYTTASIKSVSTGVFASFSINSNLSNPEIIEINTDLILNYLSTPLSASDYAFKPSMVVNGNTILAVGLNYEQLTIGSIRNITAINSGTEYNVAPIIKIDEPVISSYDKKDVYINLTNASSSFFTNEIVLQPSTGAKGIVKSSNTTVVYLRLISFENSFSNTVANTTMVGSSSGVTAQAGYVLYDYSSNSMGMNAVVEANVVSSGGSVTNLEIIDSGYGYTHDEFGYFSSTDGERIGTLNMLLGSRTAANNEQGREGRSLGRWRNQDGFLSAGKKLRDGYYYQDFSYEVRSSVTLDKYEAMLKQLLHVAGTKYFASTIRASSISAETALDTLIPDPNDPNHKGFYNFTADNSTAITVDSTSITTDLIWHDI